MDIVGIICEYDPFHKGHLHHFELIRSLLPDAQIVCLMSGCFTQRGMPALHSPAQRAKAALLAGCDLVLELPAAFSLRDAEHFALGGIQLLTSLGFITHLSFGAEDPPEKLLPAASLLSSIGEAALPQLKKGLSYPSAVEAFLQEKLPDCSSFISKPNNILALQYLRAINLLHSPISPLPVLRKGGYHCQTLCKDSFPSATAIRTAFLQGDSLAADEAAGYALPKSPVCLPQSLDSALLYRLRSMSAQEMALYPCCSEGLENRIISCAKNSLDRKTLLDALKTRRYPFTRLNRMLSQMMLFMTEELLQSNPKPTYARLLGLRRTSPLTAIMKNSHIPIISKPADGDLNDPLYQLDIRAYDLWALGAGLPAGFMFRQSPVIV